MFLGYNVIRWENGLGGLKRIFSVMRMLGIRKTIKKIRFNPPDPPNPFSHRISLFQNGSLLVQNTDNQYFVTVSTII
jgi:hypothetical protein